MKSEKLHSVTLFIVKYISCFCLIIITSLFIHIPEVQAGAEDGKKVFDNICFHCHGKEGQGILAPPLVDSTKFSGVEGIVAYVDFIMPPVNPDQCVKKDAEDTAAYMKDTFKYQFPKDMVIDLKKPGSIENGKVIYTQLCSVCHAEDGTGDLALPVEGSVRFKSKEEVIPFINTIMPVHNPDKCKGDCATATGKYILQRFHMNMSQDAGKEGE